MITFKNYKAYFKIAYLGEHNHFCKDKITYVIRDFNIFTGRLVCKYNNYGLFGIKEKNLEEIL